MSDRASQLEELVHEQEAELRRLQEEVERLRNAQQQGAAVVVPQPPSAPQRAAAVNSINNNTTASSRPQSARPHSATASGHVGGGGPKRPRYLFSSFATTLLVPPANGPQLFPCEGHSTVAYDGKVILFGGTNGATIANDTIAFHLGTGRWRRVVPTIHGNLPPTPRYGHSAVLHRNAMLVFGGYGPGGVTAADNAPTSTGVGGTAGQGQQPPTSASTTGATAAAHKTGLLNSLYSLDLQTGDWKCLSGGAGGIESAAAQQLACKNHSAVVYGDRMYIFGGCLPEGRTNAVRCYDMARGMWLPVEQLNQQSILCNTQQQQQRSSAAGGAGGAGAPRSDGGTATTDETHATKLAAANTMAQSDCPAPRSGHTACVAVRNGHTQMLIFGGRLSKFSFCSDVFQYDLQQHMWIRLYCGGDIPSSRCDHSAVVYRDYMVIFGGYSVSETGAKRYFDDAYALDLVSCTWTKVPLTGLNLPLGLCGHSSILFETTDNVVCMATFGGWGRVPDPISLADDDAERMLKQNEGDVLYRTVNDVWVMQIAKAPEPAAAAAAAAAAASGAAAVMTHSTTSRPVSARAGPGYSPRRPSPRSRPSTARSGRSDGNGSRPAFVTQSSRAATAKLFGDAPLNERLMRLASQGGSPKRSHQDLEKIVERLTSTAVHDSEIAALQKKHLHEMDHHPLSSDEQQDITDRLFYQQLLLQAERRKALESKYLATREREHVADDQIQELIARLNVPVGRPEPPPRKARATISKAHEQELLQKLYFEEPKKRQELYSSLEKKYLWGAPTTKLKPSEMEEQVQRLLAGGSSGRR